MKILIWFGTSDLAEGLYTFASAFLLPAGILLQEASLRFTYVPSYPEVYFGMIGVGVVWVLLHISMRAMFLNAYSMNRLYYEKSTGVLYDRWLRAHNVALRRETVRSLLRAVLDDGKMSRQEILSKAAHAIGRDFYHVFKVNADDGGTKKRGEALLRQLLEYDSSSGMGRFDLEEYHRDGPAARIVITVKNAFTQEHGDDPVSEFLSEYLEAICSEIAGKKLNATCNAGEDPGSIEITLVG
jgi:hypothetical protein